MITGDFSARRRLELDSLDGDFFDATDEVLPLFWERLRRERLGVVAEGGALLELAGGGFTTIGGSLRACLLSDGFLAGGLELFGRVCGFGGKEDETSLMEVAEEVEVGGGRSFLG